MAMRVASARGEVAGASGDSSFRGNDVGGGRVGDPPLHGRRRDFAARVQQILPIYRGCDPWMEVGGAGCGWWGGGWCGRAKFRLGRVSTDNCGRRGSRPSGYNRPRVALCQILDAGVDRGGGGAGGIAGASDMRCAADVGESVYADVQPRERSLPVSRRLRPHGRAGGESQCDHSQSL